MPMVLRPRKTIQPRRVTEVEFELRDGAPVTRRRSDRLHGNKAVERVTYEESDESESESVQNRVMEKHQSVPAEPEEKAADEAHLTELKHCKVFLDRLDADDIAPKKECEEKEDMNRKGGKLSSRIPTFHKRPSSGGQNTESPVFKKDPPIHVSQPPQKAGGENVESLRSKVPDAREAVSLSPMALPKVNSEGASWLSSLDQPRASPYISQISASKSWNLSGSEQLMTANPRPAIRPEKGLEQHLPEQDRSKALDRETLSVAALMNHSQQNFLVQRQEEEAEKNEAVITSKIPFTSYIDTHKSELEDNITTREVSHMDAIMNEEPPWVTEPLTTLEVNDSRSSSDAECDEMAEGEKLDDNDLGQVEDNREPHEREIEFSSSHKEGVNIDEKHSSAVKKPTRAQPTKSTKSPGCSSFVLCFFLPTTLLLVIGFSQHVWHYGLPISVAQLTAQLELHWLEGFKLLPEPCTTDCRVNLVESIPEGLYTAFPLSRQSIAESWLHLLNKANSSVHIAAFYFTLRGNDLKSSDFPDSKGRQVFQHLKKLESRGVNLQIAVNAHQTSTQDTAELAATGAEMREVDLKAVTGGIIHTKLWVVDKKHIYLGSANMDWRSLSQVKEVGLSVEDCSCLAQDAFRIFEVYYSIGGANNGSLPPYWPARLSALSSSQNPLHLKFNGVPARVYLSSAPPQISPSGRSDDLSSILSIINDAQRFVYISVMDYLPLSQFTDPLRFWPPIDTALRAAGCTRGVEVRMIISCWKHSPTSMFTFLQSLLVLSRPPMKCKIHVKLFTVPSTAEQKKIPFARVNHAKFMVTDRAVYIGTSNWSENYFTQTAGVGLIVNQTGSTVERGHQTLQSQVEELFLRDWISEYVSTLTVDNLDVCPNGGH